MALFIGKVVGTKMQKTAKVEVTRMFLHPQVLKVRECLAGGLEMHSITTMNLYVLCAQTTCTAPMLASSAFT